ncbi:YgfZ/GcvT domain-containing protein [Parendozoicomonas haliclonae]|nr:folate-binding protein YgfZ [Parendozoicomonas haliclonae]
MTTQEWLNWLTSQNITLQDGTIISSETPAEASNTITLLGHEHLLAFTGEENRKFLQGQLTCDVVALQNGEETLGACCTPKGRMVANFRMVASDNDLIAVLPADQSAHLKAHLGKYAAFFRTVSITDVSDQWVRIGLSGPDSLNIISTLTDQPAPDAGHTPSWENGIIVPVSTQRFELWIKPDAASAVWQSLAEKAAVAPTTHWQLEDIQNGIAWVTEASRDAWIPQHLNWQSLNGISFKKGCYTGQEIVARMKYLGKLKSHLFHFSAQTNDAPEIGTAVFNQDGKKTGDVVTAMSSGNGQVEILAVIRKDDAENGGLTLGEDKTPLTLVPLPYTVED